jgi:hypothetical protein
LIEQTERALAPVREGEVDSHIMSKDDFTPDPPKILPTKKQKNDEEEAREEHAGPRGIGLGTHRFTLVGKEGVGVISGKKVSACE